MNKESLKANVWAAILVELNRQGVPHGTINVESLTRAAIEATRPPVVTDSDEVKLLPTLDQLSDEQYAEAFRLFWTCPGDWTIAKLREELAARPPVVTDEVVERVAWAIRDGTPSSATAPSMFVAMHQAREVLARIASMPAVVSGGQSE